MKRFAVVLSILASIGCTSSSEKAERDTMTKDVGEYSPPPSGLVKKRVGIPPFKVDSKVSSSDFGTKEDIGRDAADQLNTLWYKSKRFDVIERTQLEQLLKEQGLEGVVDPEELAQPGRVRGVDYLCIGKVTNFRVKQEDSSSSFDLGSFGPGGVLSVKDKNKKIIVEIGVDIRLVNPTDGMLLWANFSEYKRIDSVGATGVRILGVGGGADANLQIDADSRGKLLRLALDDAIRKGLTDLDQQLLEKQNAGDPCPSCQKKNPKDAKFCAGCGGKLKD